jgi:hypothetical protein
MRALGSAVFVALALVVACGGTTSSTSPSSDAGASPVDGGGVCCPITGSPPCSCAGGGGWAASAADCPEKGGTCDVWFDIATDEHGCPALVSSRKCCGCPPPADASADAPEDAPVGDASGGACTTPSDCRVFSDYCGSCTCIALGTNDPNPACDAGTVSCLVDPCLNHTSVCDATHHCALQ